MSLVVHASLIRSWCVAGQARPDGDAILLSLPERGGHAPGVWPVHVVQTILDLEEQGAFDATRGHQFLADILNLPIALDRPTALPDEHHLLSLSRKHRLSAYDACYLDLALRLRLPLATLDPALAATADSLGIALACRRAPDPRPA